MRRDARPTRLLRAAAACLLIAPAVELASILLMPTLSTDAATQYAALVHHRAAWIAWLVVDDIALALFVGCALALAAAVRDRYRGWANAGAGLLILGLLDLIVMNGTAAVGPEMVRGNANASQMTALLDRVQHSPMTSIEDALSMTASIGLVLLAVALYRSRRAPAWSAAAIALGAILDGIGFAGGLKPVAVAAFVALLVGFARVAVTLAGSGAAADADQPKPSTVGTVGAAAGH